VGTVLKQFEHECVELFAETVQVFGVPRSVGQIYGLLFASPCPLSFSDIVQRLGISKGSVSQGLQLLRTLGAAQRMNAEERRRELYVPELGLRRLVAGMLRGKVEPVIAGGGRRLHRLHTYAQKMADEQAARFCMERVKRIEKWRRQMRLLLPVLNTLLGPSAQEPETRKPVVK
jgi:DNA-binding transcriptional regulator GbsR (MarR family)